MSTNKTVTELHIMEYEKKNRDFYRRSAALPEELLKASQNDPLIHKCVEVYIYGEMDYVKLLETLAIVQYESRKELTNKLLEIHRNKSVLNRTTE